MIDKTFINDLKDNMLLGEVLVDAPMKEYTSFKIGGPAKVLVCPGNEREIRLALSIAKENRVPVFLLGNGTNLLVSDEGYQGMILHIGKHFSEITVEGDTIHAQAGALLSRTAKQAYAHGLTGMEFAAGIPGSLGGAVAMNAGAYGGEMKDILTEVRLMDRRGNILTVPAEEMDLSYRHSCVFEKEYIVLSAKMKLMEGDKEAIEARMNELAEARRSKQPLEYPSAGSTFKRPAGYFAGKLIQDAGLKGFCVGGAQVSEKHSGFVINTGGATASDVIGLIKEVRRRVYEDAGVVMEPEVRMLGFDEEL